MPRGKLSEKYVQREAVNWLASYYMSKVSIRKVDTYFEKRVKEGCLYGLGRADGLIVILHEDERVYTASVEAKSFKTRWEISEGHDDIKLMIHGVLIGTLGLIMAVFIGRSVGGWFNKLIFPFLVFIGSAMAYIISTGGSLRYRSPHVIWQVLNYPANDSWIAVSTDVYNTLSNNDKQILRSVCRRKKVGLIRVSSGKRVCILENPVGRRIPKYLNDFLDCYSDGEGIRSALFEKGDLKVS